MFVPLTIIVAALATLILAGAFARRRLARRFVPPGRIVNVSGRRVHVEIRGEALDGPTIVLEGGLGVPGLAWAPIASRLARDARVLTYDRAGLGWSSERRAGGGADVAADELYELLRAVGGPGPFVLVGHSLGGQIVRVFAFRHPELVAGLVLLDGSHEEQFERSPAELRAFMATMTRRMAPVYRLLELLGRTGVFALRPSLIPNSIGAVPAEVLAAIRARIAMEPKIVRATGREMADVEAANGRIRALGIGTLGNVPLTVVTHGRPEGAPPQLGPAVAAEYEAVWQALQAEQAALSSRGRLIVARDVGHNIPFEAPEFAEQVIREVLAAANTAARTAPPHATPGH